LFAYNYLPRGIRMTSCGGDTSYLTMRGNLGGAGDFTCPSSGTLAYNIWTQRKCSASDVLDPNALADTNFVAPKADKAKGPGDYRPSSASALQVDKGDPVSFPAVDALGGARPNGARP